MKNYKLNRLICLALWMAVFWLPPLNKAQAGETYVQLVARVYKTGVTQHLFQPAIEGQLFALANAYRQSHGLAPLKQDDAMLFAARAHAMDMLQHHFLGHTASTGQDFDSRMRALHGGAMILPTMGENAVMWKATHLPKDGLAQKLFQSWVSSSEHRHTLLSRDYLKVSTGVAMSGNEIYADQIFVGPEVSTNMFKVQ